MVAIAASPVQDIAVADIHASPLNPRKHFDPKKLAELAENLAGMGQMEAITVRPSASQPGKYELVNGERRWRAAKLGGIALLTAKVREMSDGEALAVMLSTGAEGNVEQLQPLEEAAGYHKAMEVMALTLEGLAARFKRSVTYVQERLSLLHLPDEARTALEKKELAPSTAIQIARIPGETSRADAAKAILHSEVHGGVMPVRAAKAFIEKHVCRSLQGAPFDTASPDLVPTAGACTGCPFRAGNNKEAYGEVKNPHTCMNPTCFDAKAAAARAALLVKVAIDGKEALPAEVNAQVFPKEEAVMSWKSEYAYYTQPITRDLLKTEVSRVPTWETLLGSAGVKVWVGVDQSGVAHFLVKLSEAMSAVPADESAIFSDESVRKYGVARPAKLVDGFGRNFVEQEKIEQGLREKADRAKKKRMKKARTWLDELAAGLEGQAAAGKPAWTTYAYWSLMFERMLCALGDEDVVFVCELFGVDGNIDAEKDARAVLTDYVAKISKDRCGALVTTMTLAPWLRAEGPDAAFVTQWHDAFVAEGASPEKAEAILTGGEYTVTFSEGDVVVRMVKVPHEHANVWDVIRDGEKVARLSGPQENIDALIADWGAMGGWGISPEDGQRFQVEVEEPELPPSGFVWDDEGVCREPIYLILNEDDEFSLSLLSAEAPDGTWRGGYKLKRGKNGKPSGPVVRLSSAASPTREAVEKATLAGMLVAAEKAKDDILIVLLRDIIAERAADKSIFPPGTDCYLNDPNKYTGPVACKVIDATDSRALEMWGEAELKYYVGVAEVESRREPSVVIVRYATTDLRRGMWSEKECKHGAHDCLDVVPVSRLSMERKPWPDEPVVAKAAVPTISAEESAKLAQLVQAYDSGAGMSVQRIASEFDMSVVDVCGALEVDHHAALNAASQLRQDVEEAFESHKITSGDVRDRITGTATGRRVMQWTCVMWPEDFRRILSLLSHRRLAPAAQEDAS